MKELNLLSTELSGLNLIEASAGTGKTYTITGLYVRLILEMGCRVDGLLVVTFTNAATAELRERTRGCLVEVLQAFEMGESSDPFYQGLLDQSVDYEQAKRRLRLAILGFDQAAIFTIHGFYQRVLSEHAFESGMPFESELVSEQTELLQEVVADFWRCEIQDLSPGLVDYLLAEKVTPESLLASVQKGIGKPYLEVRGMALPADLASQEAMFLNAYKQARSIWADTRQDIQDLLQSDASLNGNKYRKSSLVNWFQQMNDYLNSQSGTPFDKFIKFTSSELAASVKKGKPPPKHVFFDACEALAEIWGALALGYAQALVTLKQNLLTYCNQELSVRKAKARIQSFDDLLLDLDSALSGEHGAVLIEAIRQRYSAVLIDEFQDTDPIQYHIFSMITHDSELPVFLVGDPKQAIYSFRGADIFAYHDARKDAKNCYTLKTNWRSDPKLIKAVNALFKQSHASFFYDWIPFYEVEAAAKQRDDLHDSIYLDAPFRVWLIEGEESVAKADAEQLAARATVVEIARLLKQGQEGQVRIGDRKLSGGDIAVLVHEHRQATIIAQQLSELGVYSVQQSRENIFHSHEAMELLCVLTAIAEPAKQTRIKAALVTDMLGLDGHDIEHLQVDEQALELQLESFRNYHQLWQERGFVRMFHQLLSHEQIAKRLLSRANGERCYTNLQHLGELVHQHDSVTQSGMEGLVKWLSRQCQNRVQTSEEQELRLESDEDLVQIITIHKSKGLEYPIVFCPFVWADKTYAESKKRPFFFHDEKESYKPVLELGSERFEEDRKFAIQEERAENLRLLYVAMTRAQYRCYITWGNISGTEQSALAWLLHSDKSSADASNSQAELSEWVKKSDNGVWVGSIPEEDGKVVQSCNSQYETGSVRLFSRRFDTRSRVTSFTALTSEKVGDQPDYDEQLPARIDRPAAHDIFGFPRGARAGCCIHSIFEQIDFATYEREKLELLVEDVLIANGFETDWMLVIADMVESVLSTPLDTGKILYLKSVGVKQRLVELEFYYPLAAINAEGLRTLLLEYEFASADVMRQAIERINFADVNGFMKGFIDLVFEVDGCFYLADYKSNWLGDDPSAYSSDHLVQAMAHENYYLQYLFYILALHRYLSLRLPDYDYDLHFGGAFYLFVRGMNPSTGSACGVYWDKPSKQLIEAMDHYLIAQ